MPVDKQKNKQVKVTIPNELYDKLKTIAEARGTPLAQLLLQAAIDRYKDDLGI